MKQSFFDRSITTRELLFIIAVVLCLTPWISPAIALLMGLIVAQFIGHPYLHLNHKATTLLLQFSVVGLGFGMNFTQALNAGSQGIKFTIISIVGTLVIGCILGYYLKVDKKISYLVSSGTAICGGSAIAAISPIIKAEEKQISVALGTIFVLNSIALFIFPFIGHQFSMSQEKFGLWCALAIHDTSSVLGAAGHYGDKALEVATVVKLARALWIIPLAFVSSFIFKFKGKVKIPYFIGYFVLAILFTTYFPIFEQHLGFADGLIDITKTGFHYISKFAKSGLTLTLFLIGCGLNRSALKEVGVKPLIQGVILWILISTTSLYVIMNFA